MTTIITKKGIAKDNWEIVPPEYDEIDPVTINGKPSDKIFRTVQDGILGILVLTKKSYNAYYGFRDIAYVGEDCIIASNKTGKYMLMNTNKLDELTEYEYDSIEKLAENVFRVCMNGVFNILDKKGKKLFNRNFSEIKYDINTRTFSTKM